MANTITISKLIQKLQTLLDEEGDLKVLFAAKDGEVSYGTIHPDPSYEGDMDVEQDQQLLVIYANKVLSDPDELLTGSSTRKTKSALDAFSPDDEDEDYEEEDDYYKENVEDWADRDKDDWDYGDDDD